MPLSPSDLDDIQRTAYEPASVVDRALTLAAPHLRSLLRIRGIGRFDKVSPAAAIERFRLISEDLIAGLYNDRTHLAFILRGEPGTISVEIGTWLTQGTATQLEQSLRVLRSALASLSRQSRVLTCQPTSRRRYERVLL